MAESQPRFALVDDDSLKDIIASADSENTKKQVRYATKIFEDYLSAATEWDLPTVDQLPNSALDEILAKFYASARQQNSSKWKFVQQEIDGCYKIRAPASFSQLPEEGCCFTSCIGLFELRHWILPS